MQPTDRFNIRIMYEVMKMRANSDGVCEEHVDYREDNYYSGANYNIRQEVQGHLVRAKMAAQKASEDANLAVEPTRPPA